MSAARKLFFFRGFSGTSVEEITKEAKISKGLFYHYFKSKEELLISFYDEIREYFENLKTYENPLDALKKFGCDFLANNADEYKDAPLLQVFLITFADRKIDISKHEEENLIVKDFGREYLGSFFEKGIAQGIFREGNAQNYGDIYWSFLLGKLLPIKKGNENKGAAIYIEEILSVFER